MALAVLMGLVGCGRGPLERDPFAEWTERDAQLGELGAELSREVGPVSTEVTGEKPGEVDLKAESGVNSYVRRALERNPRLAAARQKVARLAERVPQATSLEDPRFNVAPAGEMAETAAGQVGLMTGLSQELPWPGKLGARGRAAAQRVAEAAAALERTRQEIVAEVRRAYWRLYSAVRAIEVMEASRSLLQQFREISEARFRAGTTNQQDVLRASVELSNLDKELHTLRQRRDAAEAMLNRLMDRPVEMQVPDPPTASIQRTEGELTAWLKKAERQSSSLRAVRERIERRREEVELAELQRWPNFTVGAHYNAVEDEGLSRIANGEDQWWFSLGFNLPIWDTKLDAAEAEARRGVLEGLAELRAEQSRVSYAVREAFDRMRTHRHHVTLLSESIVPESRQAAEAALSRYQAGEGDALTVIDNWRRMLQFERMRYEHRALFEEAAADLREAVSETVAETAEGAKAAGAAGAGRGVDRPESGGASGGARDADPSASETDSASGEAAESSGGGRDEVSSEDTNDTGAGGDAAPGETGAKEQQ